MVVTCILCKKDATPWNEGRSFHQFPKDEQLKKDWMHATGLTAVTKTALICSDHFDVTAFRYTGSHRIRKRLLPNAVPQKETQSANAQSITHAENMVAESSNIESGNILASTSGYHCSDDETAVTANDSMKRKHSVVDERTVKKARFTTGYETEYISRKDFISDEAWERFTRYHTHKRLQLKAEKSRNMRKENKISSINALINHLKEKQFSVATDYFKEPPKRKKLSEAQFRIKKREKEIQKEKNGRF